MLRRSAALLVAGLCLAQTPAPGPQITSFKSTIDDTEQPYALYVPPALGSQQKYPLVISLHGPDSNHRLNLRRVFGIPNRYGETDVQASQYFPRLKDVPYLVAAPLARGTLGYQGIGEKDVYDVLADVKRRFPVDEDRVYLTGLSTGGTGSLWLALSRPDVWAAVASVSPAPPNNLEPLAANASNLPIRIFQGALDPTVPVAQTRSWHKLLLDAGVNATYVEYPNVRHNAWDLAYKDGAIFNWFGQFHRDRTPDRVQFSTRDYEHARAYWLQLDHFTPGTLASVDAKFTAQNALEIRTEQLDGLSLHLAAHPKWNPKLSLSIDLDGTKLRVRPTQPLSFSRTGHGWVNRKAVFSAGEKKPGSEGPIRDAISERHIYVYGTADGPSEAEAARRKQEAEQAAAWATPRYPLRLKFATKMDRAVTDSDWKNSSLILFGNRDTNTLIAKLSPNLPMQLNPDAADYGLVVLAPTSQGHYAVVSSGLPWWTRADQARRPGLPLNSPPFNILLSLGDYVLFKGGIDIVASEGMFDRNWQLSRAQRDQLAATHAVTLK